MLPQPKNTTLVQVGFNEALNYDFVANHPTSANQIFGFLPQGIAFGLGIDVNNCTMHSLQPYDTQQEQGYITTLATAYIPSGLVNALALDLHTPASKIYSNPDGSVNALMNLVNPTIPILAGPGDGSEANAAGAPGGPGSTGSGQGSMGGNGGSSQVRGTSVGIGVGVVAGAAVYGAAMFYVARRYKRRKQGHARTSSIHNGSNNLSPSVRYNPVAGAPMMSGARYTDRPESPSSGSDSRTTGARSTAPRQAGISRPVMAENSLGFT